MQQNQEEENKRKKDAAPTALLVGLSGLQKPTQAILKPKKAGETRRLQKKNAISKDTGCVLRQKTII